MITLYITIDLKLTEVLIQTPDGPRGFFKSPLNLLEPGVPRATNFSDSSPLSYFIFILYQIKR